MKLPFEQRIEEFEQRIEEQAFNFKTATKLKEEMTFTNLVILSGIQIILDMLLTLIKEKNND